MPGDTEILASEDDPNVLQLAVLVEGALSSPNPMHLQEGGATLKEIWIALREEVFDLLCTDSKKYRTERTLFQTTTSKPVVALLASFLTSGFGLPVATAAGLASLALLLPVKMAMGAWCRAHKNAKELDGLEIETLQKLRQKRKKASASGSTK